MIKNASTQYKENHYQRQKEKEHFFWSKRDRTIKSQHCANGSTQRDYMTHEEVSSLTVSTEATLLTTIIEAEEGRDIMMLDIPNVFMQTKLEQHDKDGNRTIMKIQGVLVDILIKWIQFTRTTQSLKESKKSYTFI